MPLIHDDPVLLYLCIFLYLHSNNFRFENVTFFIIFLSSMNTNQRMSQKTFNRFLYQFYDKMQANESKNKKRIKFNIYVRTVNPESSLVRHQFDLISLEGNSCLNAQNIETTTMFEPNIQNPIDLQL